MWHIKLVKLDLYTDLYILRITNDCLKSVIEEPIDGYELNDTGISYNKESIVQDFLDTKYLHAWLLTLRISKWFLKFCMNHYKYLLC